MRRFALPLLAASSLLLVCVGNASTRSRYGGAAHVATHIALNSLDPSDPSQGESVARRNISRLIFDTLVTLDDRGKPLASLAGSWQPESGNQRWQFRLRSGVSFHDGTPLASDIVAASLRAANPNWRVFSAGNAVTIETDAPSSEFPAELALPRNAIARRDGAKLLGTGPFAVADWQPGKKLSLRARDDYWGGRPFVDSIEIELGKNLREQMISLDLGKMDFIEIPPEQAHRAAAEGRRVESSTPIELMALVFSRDRQSPEEGKLRQALAFSIDRSSLNNVLLQGGGEPAGGILPNWLTGYAFLFPRDTNLERARQARDAVRQVPTWTLGYDAGDPAARMVAERIALNARDGGLVLQPTISVSSDVRLVRIPLASLDAGIALRNVAAALGLPQPRLSGNSAADLYAAESVLLESQRIIPLLHLRVSYGIGANVKNWTQDPAGGWRLNDVWLGMAKP